MITAYYTDNELEKAKSVSDKELNELLQEVRQIDSRFYLVEQKFVSKRWFRKPIEKIGYTLLADLGGECQVINFCQDHDWSINGTVSKSYIYTFFLGYINGVKTASK